MEVPAILVSKHGPFTWGDTVEKAVENALVLDEIAHMAYCTQSINSRVRCAPDYLLDKHYDRKHGKDAYDGQTVEK